MVGNSNGHRATVAEFGSGSHHTHRPRSESRSSVVDSAVPPRSASFAEKMDYYRSQHSTKGIRATHLVGIPGVAVSLPLLAAAPRKGLPLLAASWALQVLGHKVWEKNNPTLTQGFLTYQFCGLAFWCEEMVDLLAGRGLGGR